jgi:hypothetical protein
MDKSKTTAVDSAGQHGFRISEKPVVGAAVSESQLSAEPPAAEQLPSYYGGDLLYAIARDPNSLFLYWDLDWPRIFSGAELTRRAVHLRISRDDGTEETTIAIDPELGYCFAGVDSANARYTCELGCFVETEWKSLAPSASAETPASTLSDDLSAEFATLPLHLSFQRLIDIFRAAQPTRKTLATAIAEMQSKARVLQASVPEADWPRLVEAAAALVVAEANPEAQEETYSSDLAAVLLIDRTNSSRQPPEMIQRWKILGEKFAGPGWGGASKSGFGGSSPT